MPASAQRLRQHDEQVEKAGHDDNGKGRHGDGAARVPRLLAERGGRFEAGERGDAVDHRVGDIAELAVRRRRRREDRGRVVRRPGLHQDRDGQCRDHGDFPGGQQQRRVGAGQRDPGGRVQRVRADHHPAGQETPGLAQAAAVEGVQRACRGQPPGELRDAVRAAQRRDERDDHHQRRGEPRVGHEDEQPGGHRAGRSHAAHTEREHPRRPDNSVNQPGTVLTTRAHAVTPSPQG